MCHLAMLHPHSDHHWVVLRKWCMLNMLTSIWVLCTQTTGQNILFQSFLCKVELCIKILPLYYLVFWEPNQTNFTWSSKVAAWPITAVFSHSPTPQIFEYWSPVLILVVKPYPTLGRDSLCPTLGQDKTKLQYSQLEFKFSWSWAVV